MPWVTLRCFGWTEKTLRSGQVDVDKFFRIRADRVLPVNVAELIYVNALAPAGSNPVKYATRVHELALITTYLTTRADDALVLRTSDFKSSSLHIKRLVSESLGLGMLTATVEALYRWDHKNNLFNFDALPLALAHTFKKRGPRPDLLFEFPQDRMAGEARGRSRAAPTKPRSSQRERLSSLLAWSRLHGDHDVVMTWAYLTPKGVTVDFYVHADGISWLPQDFGVPMPPDADPPLLRFDAPVLGSDAPVQAQTVAPVSPRRAIAPRPPDQTPPAQLALNARENLDQVASDLYADAPRTNVHVNGQELRGRWMSSNVLDESGGQILLGLLPERLPPERSAQLTMRLRRRGASARDQQTSDRFTATVRDRVVVVYAQDYHEEPWQLIEDVD